MTSNQADTVSQIVAIQRENESKFKSIEVFKEVEPYIDLGNLLLLDLQPINSDELKANHELFLSELARDNAQLLFNQIWKLPIERMDNIVFAKLPEPSTLLPREKPIPKAKPPTKWEIYAKKKGIMKKKRSRMLWDEEAKAWKPRHGYKRTKDDTKEWCIEVPQNSDQNEDQFEKKEAEKKERIAKNELKRLGNIARNKKTGSITSSQFRPTQAKDKERVSKEIDVAKLSTASMGKFQQKLPNEKENKKTGKKRKFESVSGSGVGEKQRALEILKKINKPGKVDLTKAVNKKLYEEKVEGSSKLSSGKVKNKRFRKGKQSTLDKMKSRTLGKSKKKR